MAPALLAISGPSSSGKTTIARHLVNLFPSSLLLHEDDFYRPEAELPLRAGFKDWDCAAAIDISALLRALNHIKEHRTLPEWLDSKEAGNEVGEDGIRSETLEKLREKVGKWFDKRKASGREKRLVVVDGFLLFGESVKEIRDALDLKILLRASFEKAKARREKRSGYVTLEGFWEDPPGYVDKVVWPGFVEEHGFLFRNGDVGGEVDEEMVRKLGIRVCPGKGKWGMEEVLEWVVETVMEEIDQEGD